MLKIYLEYQAIQRMVMDIWRKPAEIRTDEERRLLEFWRGCCAA